MRFSLEAGLVSSGYYGKSGGLGLYAADKWGGRFGAGFDTKISNHVSAQAGGVFIMNGYNQNTAKGDLTFALNTFEVPLNFIYKLDKPLGNRLFIGIGPYIAINMFGKKTYKPLDSTAYSWQINAGSDTRDDIKLFDFGAGVQAGYEFEKGLFFRVFYQTSLINMNTNGNDNNILKNKNSGVSIGYLFNSKKRKALMGTSGFRNNGLEM